MWYACHIALTQKKELETSTFLLFKVTYIDVGS